MRYALAVMLVACGGPSKDPIGESCMDPPRGPAMTRLERRRDAIEFSYTTDLFKGGGLAIADLDGDDRPEIVAGSRIGGLAVFHNRGGLRFERVDAGLDATLAAHALAIADLDNDGDRDLVIAGANVASVMANRGDGTFDEVAQLTGSGMTEHVLPADLDGDGLLDLYFSNYDIRSATNSENRLYRNLGALRFDAIGQMGAGLSWTATAFDADDDGDQDLYIANDTLAFDKGDGVPMMGEAFPSDLLLRNDGGGSFTNIAADVGLAAPRSSMGGVLGDFDDDGRLDIYIPDFGAKKVFVRDGGGFVERAAQLGVMASSRISAACEPGAAVQACLLLSWSAALADFDLDGHDEIVVVNGETVPGEAPPVLWFTRGSQTAFHELAPEMPCMDARALVATDLDGDGDPDLAIAYKEGPLEIYENRGSPPTRSWLRVTLRGRTSNREGIGGIVKLVANGRVQTRAVGAGGVIHSASPAEAMFGVAGAIDSVEVLWPSGRRTLIAGPTGGALVVDEDQ